MSDLHKGSLGVLAEERHPPQPTIPDSMVIRFEARPEPAATLYLSAMGVLAERFGALGGPVRWTNYLMAGGRLIGIHVENSDETTLTR